MHPFKIIVTCSSLIIASLCCANQKKLHFDEHLLYKPIKSRFDQIFFEYNCKNESNEVVEIKDVRVNCACTAYEVTKTKILPGETSKVIGVLDMKSRPESNLVRIVLTLITDEKDVEYELIGMAGVNVSIELNPHFIVWKKSEIKKNKVVEVKITDFNQKKVFESVMIKESKKPSGFDYNVEKAEEKNKFYITIRPKENLFNKKELLKVSPMPKEESCYEADLLLYILD